MQNSGYISKAACRGYRPRRLQPSKGRSRPHLIARLTRERSVARFIVAPVGYGKTHLAVEYAETMFSWVHVFWLNAKSPCFIRDLDDGDIARECFAVDEGARLVVFEGIPQLDAQRLQLLSREIDALLSKGCEVLVTCLPSSDLLGGFQHDRMRLGAVDLLLSDDELDALRTEEERMRCPVEQIPASCRVPTLVWGPHTEMEEAFIAGSFGEDVPSDLLLVVCSALVLQRGDLADFGEVGPIGAQLIEDVLADYPPLGCDVEEGTFEAPLFDADALARTLRGRIDDVVDRSRFDTRDELAQAWANILLERHSVADRACDVVRLFCTVRTRARWMLEHARELVRNGCFYPPVRLITSMRKSRYDARDCVLAFEALCRRMLGDDEGAVYRAKRCAFESGASVEAQTLGLIITARLATGDLKARASAVIIERAAARGDSGSDSASWWDALIDAWAAKAEGAEQLARRWESLKARGAGDDELSVIASWLYDGMGNENPDVDLEAFASFEPIERFVRARLSGDGADGHDFFAASAGLAMEGAHARGMAFSDGPLPAVVLLALRRVEMAMLVQRRLFDQELRREQVQQGGWNSTRRAPDLFRTDFQAIQQPVIPLLDVRIFGRFDATIGGMPLDPKKANRKHARVLLVLLVANRGRDLTRDAIAQALWPKSTIDIARKNYYTVWSQLKRMLTLPDGSCPYLIRHQFGCRLDDRYVRSDAARLDQICRELLFGRLDFEEWLEMYTEIDRDFSDDLLPMEQSNYLITKARDDYRGRLVDALVSATYRLIDAGNPQYGIWFARAALDHERLREDAYVALMKAQIAYNQRTAAMMTYLNCRRVLADELGIDPSPETTALYESLLGG